MARFPTDFIFQLTEIEQENLRSQFAISNVRGGRRYPTRIGRELIRYAELIENELKLITPLKSFGRAICKWNRMSASQK